MKGFGLLPSLARSASAMAVATYLVVPGIALAQTVQEPGPATVGQNAGSTATNARPEDAPVPEGTVAQPTGQKTLLADGNASASGDEIVVTGVRASLDRAINIKRTSSGIVDAISAEDIGKFPDTNLAESLQRITGVAIDRNNGEGSEVTVRGFGGGFNLVTLNGRNLPAANVNVVGTDNGDFATGTSRSFDFSNLASEGVSTLEVYKTGRAAIPTGGIGATINIVTRRPLDKEGFSGSIGVKGLYDTSVDDFEVTPEVSGFASWSNNERRFGVSVFGSYQKRNFASWGATSNDWNIERASSFLSLSNDRVDANTQFENRPTTNQLVAFPNDSRYFFSEGERERINGQAVVQFEPMDGLRFTADALYAQNKIFEQRSEQSNWLNRPFGFVRFDGNQPVTTAEFISQTISGGGKDTGFEQQYRATKDRIESYGLNGRWDINDRLTLNVDGHHSVATSGGNNPNGASSTTVSVGAPIVASQSLDYSSGFPVQSVTINDAARAPTTAGGFGTNPNGVYDPGDLGTQVQRQIFSSQRQRINEGRIDLGWELDDTGTRFDIGGNYRDVKLRQLRTQQQQTLGDWGITRPGDVERIAPGLVQTFCLVCKFDKYKPGRSAALDVAFRGNAVDLFNALSPAYAQPGTVYSTSGNPLGLSGQDNNTVTEKIWAVYGQLTWKAQIAERPATLVAGLRYEETRTGSDTIQSVPDAIAWVSDNDFTPQYGNRTESVSQRGKYDNLLPSVDFSIEPLDDMLLRASYSKTIARPNYSNLFSVTTAGAPPRPTVLGGVPGGSTGNAGLQPLESDNVDFSAEWYYKPSSFISVGYFDKRVRNFIGVGQFSSTLFGLRDPSAAGPGSRSGLALAQLNANGYTPSDANLFTLTALIQENGGNVPAALQTFQNNLVNGALPQTYINEVLARVDLVGNAQDPLYSFQVSQPINNRQANIHGAEFAVQHFFGDTGIGVAGSYTLVRGDVGFDVGADTNVDQFALVGLSDTAQATLIYDKYGISGRLTYNWRDSYLAETSRGGYRNPVFVAPYGQLDLNISVDVTPQLAVSLEAINLTEEKQRTYGRSKNNMWFATEPQSRYLLGARFRF